MITLCKTLLESAFIEHSVSNCTLHDILYVFYHFDDRSSKSFASLIFAERYGDPPIERDISSEEGKVNIQTPIGMIDKHNALVHSADPLWSCGGAAREEEIFHAKKCKSNLTPRMRDASDFDIGFSKPPGGCLANWRCKGIVSKKPQAHTCRLTTPPGIESTAMFIVL